MLNLIARIGNVLKDKGEEAAAILADRIVRGERISSQELNLLIEALPKLDLRDWEIVTAGVADGVALSVGLNVLTAAGLGAVSNLIAVGGSLGFVGSLVPCMLSEAAIERNPNLSNYCGELLEVSYDRILTSRIRGYLRGVVDRVRHDARIDTRSLP